MSFLTAELQEKKSKALAGEGSFSKADRDNLHDNLESLRPDNHAYSDEAGKCFYCGATKQQHKTCVVVTGKGREVRKV